MIQWSSKCLYAFYFVLPHPCTYISCSISLWLTNSWDDMMDLVQSTQGRQDSHPPWLLVCTPSAHESELAPVLAYHNLQKSDVTFWFSYSHIILHDVYALHSVNSQLGRLLHMQPLVSKRKIMYKILIYVLLIHTCCRVWEGWSR